MKNMNYLMDHIPYQVFKIILNISQKYVEKTENSSINIYVNKIEKKNYIENKDRVLSQRFIAGNDETFWNH